MGVFFDAVGVREAVHHKKRLHTAHTQTLGAQTQAKSYCIHECAFRENCGPTSSGSIRFPQYSCNKCCILIGHSEVSISHRDLQVFHRDLQLSGWGQKSKVSASLQ